MMLMKGGRGRGRGGVGLGLGARRSAMLETLRGMRGGNAVSQRPTVAPRPAVPTVPANAPGTTPRPVSRMAGAVKPGINSLAGVAAPTSTAPAPAGSNRVNPMFMAKGGKVGRGDGCCMKGKTKGKKK